MPEIGEIKHDKQNKYTWLACIDCGKERWTKPGDERCRSCCRRGERSPCWKGGRVMMGGGYIAINLTPDDFFSSMRNKRGYVLEHRLVMAKHLGRNLHPWEVVHHKNGIKDDNKLENLQLVSDERHQQITILESIISRLENLNQELRERIKELEKNERR